MDAGGISLPGQQQAKGPGGIAAEFPAHHLQTALAPQPGGNGKAHLLRLSQGQNIPGHRHPLLRGHRRLHNGSDIPRRVRIAENQLHDWENRARNCRVRSSLGWSMTSRGSPCSTI